MKSLPSSIEDPFDGGAESSVCCVIVPEWSSSELVSSADVAGGIHHPLHSLTWAWALRGFRGSFGNRFRQTSFDQPDVMVGGVAPGQRIALPEFLGASVSRFRGYELLRRGIEHQEKQGGSRISIRMFPYDWRELFEVSAQRLNVYLDALGSSLNQRTRIVLVGHGFGGIIAALARAFSRRIYSVVTIGTAWAGTIESAQKYVNGFRFGPGRAQRSIALRSFPSSTQRLACYRGSLDRAKRLSHHRLFQGLPPVPETASANLISRDLLIVGNRQLFRTQDSVVICGGQLSAFRRSEGDGVVALKSSIPKAESLAKISLIDCRHDRLITDIRMTLVVREHLANVMAAS
jgi:pimeloyl-ACP methyl ester carboxylesterase